MKSDEEILSAIKEAVKTVPGAKLGKPMSGEGLFSMLGKMAVVFAAAKEQGLSENEAFVLATTDFEEME